jgi:hypothetical protein
MCTSPTPVFGIDVKIIATRVGQIERQGLPQS